MAPKDVLDLHICIIGAGMGGLVTALSLAKQGFTHIDVYEAASNLGFVGAGIQLAPNMARILDRLGVWADIEKEAVDLKATSIRRVLSPSPLTAFLPTNKSTEGATDEELGHVDLTYIRPTYAYPHMVGHRASLAGSIAAGCKREGAVKFHFSTSCGTVSSYGPHPTFTAVPRSGTPYDVSCNVLLAADGVKSTVRDQLLRLKDVNAKIIDTGQAAYRIMLTRDQMSHDPELIALLDEDCVTRWIGPKRHIIAYPVSNKTIYNLSTTQPDLNFAAAPSSTYTTTGSKKELLATFSDFCPKVLRMLDLVPDGEVCEWKLRVHEPLPFWVEGSTALIGDACHPTLPHLGQGAAQAIEDGGVLGVVLSRLPSTDPQAINKALRVYEIVRKERAYTLVELAAASGRAMHLGEGAAKAERDAQFAALKKEGGKVPDKWADKDVQREIYGVDIVKVAGEKFEEYYAEV